MPTHGRQDDAEDAPEDERAAIAAHESCPGRVVFTEEGNSDGWIATDLTVEVER